MSRFSIFFLAVLVFLDRAHVATADTIKLEGGRTVKGQIVEEKSTRDKLVVRLQSGNAEVTLDRSEIQEIIEEENPLEEYDKVKSRYADTAEDQFKLAMWCESNRLFKQRRVHLQKAIELDPDHAAAREKLGYVKHDGKWLTANQLKEARGLVRFQGKYVTPQEREILEQKKRQEDEEKEWHGRVKMWKSWMSGSDAAKARQGEEQLRAIEDPLALEAVVGHLGKDKDEAFRILMCDILGRLPGEPATLELVKRCIIDVSPYVRWAATDRLAAREDPQAVRTLLDVLKSEHNVVIRRAAEALGAIGDPIAVPALIDVLVTKHKQVVTRPGGASFLGNQGAAIIDYEAVVAPGVVAFRPVIGYQAQGVGLSAPSQEVVVVPVENQEARDALVEITGEDLGYNQAAWRSWWTNQKRRDEVKRRR